MWTRSDPPRSSWSHPLDSQPQSFLPQGNFAPPPNPPPPDRIGYSSGGVGGGNRPYNPPQPAPAPYTGQQQFQPSSFPAGGGGGFSSNTNTQDARYAQTPGYQALPNYGAPSPTYGHQWPNWQQPQPQQGTRSICIQGTEILMFSNLSVCPTDATTGRAATGTRWTSPWTYRRWWKWKWIGCRFRCVRWNVMRSADTYDWDSPPPFSVCSCRHRRFGGWRST